MRDIILSLILIITISLSLNSKTIDKLESVERYIPIAEPEIIELDEFLAINAHLESRNTPNVANRAGCFGLYQMNKYALTELGFSEKKLNKMLRSIKIKENDVFHTFDTTHFGVNKQREMIEEYLFKIQTHYLKHSISKYVGKKIGGVKITRAGILSASFLGYLNVAKYLQSNGRINYRDGNGYTVKQRLSVFSNKEVEEEMLYSFL